MSPSVREIIELNIDYYLRKLRTESDPSKRRTIAGLLREEEIKLAKLARSISDQPAPSPPSNPADETD